MNLNTESSFTVSSSYKSLKLFINEIVKSIKTEDQNDNEQLTKILDDINNIITSTPLSSERGRYANPNAKEVFLNISNTKYNDIEDLEKYLKNSFGNSKRLDYGTGHELNFLCFCYSAKCASILSLNEVYNLFKKYWSVSRHFISKFNLEPAGSKGSWSLDDYQLLHFVFGAAQGGYVFDKLILSTRSLVTRNLKTIEDYINLYDREVLMRNVVTKSFIYSRYLAK
ncbi:serine/threonine-protein phosphatase 2A activator (PTPA) [Vairimorpha necatrix]|uniref:Serine/threonine-protein phosphatase 2A activator n=1 Tax=Vairimorpha necatrix TaxID=6039 RepID=A0AAX4J832_9MICR